MLTYFEVELNTRLHLQTHGLTAHEIVWEEDEPLPETLEHSGPPLLSPHLEFLMDRRDAFVVSDQADERSWRLVRGQADLTVSTDDPSNVFKHATHICHTFELPIFVRAQDALAHVFIE